MKIFVFCNRYSTNNKNDFLFQKIKEFFKRMSMQSNITAYISINIFIFKKLIKILTNFTYCLNKPLLIILSLRKFNLNILITFFYFIFFNNYV